MAKNKRKKEPIAESELPPEMEVLNEREDDDDEEDFIPAD